MRFGRPIAAAPLLAAAVLAMPLSGAPAAAQVSVNPGALDLLPAQPQRPAARPAPARPQPHPPATRAPTSSAPNAPAAPTAPTQATKPAVPTVPPAIAALPPPLPVPTPRKEAAPVVPVAADAPGAATPVANGLRVTFGPDRQDLNPATEAALRLFARGQKNDDRTGINVYAYASGSPDDPSTARRLSLGRALAARAVLINEGIPSTRIYPRALGSTGGDADRDRVDLLVGPPAAPAPAPAPALAGSAAR